VAIKDQITSEQKCHYMNKQHTITFLNLPESNKASRGKTSTMKLAKRDGYFKQETIVTMENPRKGEYLL
jgi:hypothetical protein